jgi:hypothetical protein
VKVTKFEIEACCGKTKIVFRVSSPILPWVIAKLVSLGFKEHTDYSKRGILYVDNSDLILISPIGSSRIDIKCKNFDCKNKVSELEELISRL